MNLTLVGGDILSTEDYFIVNPVNTLGVSGAGLAYQIKQKYPQSFKLYRNACLSGKMSPGGVLVSPEENGKRIIHLFTKANWRFPSRQEWIEKGMYELCELLKRDYVHNNKDMYKYSISLPLLGAGLGGLNSEIICDTLQRICVRKLHNTNYTVHIYKYHGKQTR